MNAPLSITRGYCGVEVRRRGPNRKGVLTVDAVRSMYAAGHTQDEIAVAFDVSQYKVGFFMRRNGIKARVAAKRDQRGALNHTWAGNKATYLAAHKRVYRTRGKAFGCGKCGSQEDQKYHWANLTGDYLNPMDFMSMCVSCHRRYDNERRRINDGKPTITR
jgi:hypothetical protein